MTFFHLLSSSNISVSPEIQVNIWGSDLGFGVFGFVLDIDMHLCGTAKLQLNYLEQIQQSSERFLHLFMVKC